MKRILILAHLFIVVNSSLAQSSDSLESRGYPLVKVKNWGERALTMSEDGWSDNKYQIIEQVGEKEFYEIKKNYDWKSIPEEMTLFSGQKMKKRETLYKKLDSLAVIYKIATYNYIYEGKIKDRRVILKIPYKGNEAWDKNVKWNNIYVLIKEDAVEEIRNKSK